MPGAGTRVSGPGEPGRRSRRPWVLAGLLATALLLRAGGILQGLPWGYHPDEPVLLDVLLRMLEEADPNPRFFHYPALYLYLELLVLAPARWTLALFLEPGDPWMRGGLYLAGRGLTAVCGTAAVGVVYSAGRRLAGEWGGLGSAACLGLSFLHVQNSQWIATDVPASLATAACLAFALRGAAEDSRRDFLLSGLCAGLAAAVKYNAGLVGLATAALWAASRRRPRDLASWTPVAFTALCMAVFLVANPWIVLDPLAWEQGVELQWRHYHGGHHGHEGEHNLLFYLDSLWSRGLTPGWVLAALAGLPLLVRRRGRETAALLVFPVLYLVLLSSVKVRFERNLMPLLPFLAVVAGAGGACLLRWFRSLAATQGMRRFSAVLALALLVAYPLARATVYDAVVVGRDTRTEARAWILQNIPVGTSLCTEAYGPLLPQDRYPIQHDWSLCAGGALGLREIAAGDCTVAVASSRMYGRYLEEPERYPALAGCYDFIFRRWPLVREFRGTEWAEHDPVVRVLLVPRAGAAGARPGPGLRGRPPASPGDPR